MRALQKQTKEQNAMQIKAIKEKERQAKQEKLALQKELKEKNAQQLQVVKEKQRLAKKEIQTIKTKEKDLKKELDAQYKQNVKAQFELLKGKSFSASDEQNQSVEKKQ